MRTCTWCNREQDEEEFAWKNKAKGIKLTACRQCHAEYTRQHYKENKDYYAEKARRRQTTNREHLRRIIWEYLEQHPCVDCGLRDPVVMEFDHVSGEKRMPVSRMIHQGYSEDVVLAEIEKCEVRCANCHKRRTSQQLRYWYTKQDAGMV